MAVQEEAVQAVEAQGPDLGASFFVSDGELVLSLVGPEGPIGHLHLGPDFLRALAGAVAEVTQ